MLYGEDNLPDWCVAKRPSELFIYLNHHEVRDNGLELAKKHGCDVRIRCVLLGLPQYSTCVSNPLRRRADIDRTEGGQSRRSLAHFGPSVEVPCAETLPFKDGERHTGL
jgi:hypothetical protein